MVMKLGPNSSLIGEYLLAYDRKHYNVFCSGLQERFQTKNGKSETFNM